MTVLCYLTCPAVSTNRLTHTPCFCVRMFGITKGSTSDPALLCPHQHTFSSCRHDEEQSSPPTTRWRCSTSNNHSDLTGPQTDSPRGVAAQKNITSWSNQGRSDSIRQTRDELRDSLSENSDDSDAVFSKELSVWSRRLYERLNTAPPRQRAPLHHPQERNCRSLGPRSSFTDELRDLEEERQESDEDYYENGDLQRRRPRNQVQERNYREEYDGWHRSRHLDTDSGRLAEAGERRFRRSESVRLHNRRRHSNRDLERTGSYKDNPDKRVHFRDDNRNSQRQQSESSKVWEMLGHVLRERGVPVKFGGNGAPLQIRPQSRDSQVLHGSEVSYGDSQPHQRVFQRAATTRHSFHGDIRERRRLSYRENSGRDQREDGERQCDNGDVYEISNRDSYLANRERRGSRRWKEHRYTNKDEREKGNAHDYRVRRTTSVRNHWHKTAEERLRTEEEQEVERRAQRPQRRAPQYSQSLRSCSRASARDRSRHVAAGNTQSRSQL